MRDGWVQTPIGDVAQVLSGFAFKSELFNKTEGIPLIRIRDLPKRDSTEALYSGSYEDRYVVKKGDFLIGMDGEFHCYEWNGPDALLNQRVCRIQDFKLAIVIPRYIYFAVNQYLDKIEQDTGYTTVKHISAKQVLGITIPLPPLPEQKRIVDLISSVDTYIKALWQQLESAKRSRNAVLHALLTAGGDDWIERKLPDVVEVLDRMRKPINSTEREERKGTIPYYGANGQTGWIDEFIFNEELVLLGEDAIDFADPSARKAYLIQGPSWVNNHAHVLRADTTIINSYFLMESLNKVDYSQYVSFGTRSKLTQASMNGIKVLVPSMKIQEKIVDLLANFDEVIQETQKSIGDSQVLRSGMLSNLLSGEHEIPASYDKVMDAA
jgi:type I restriction enzyme S subunit